MSYHSVLFIKSLIKKESRKKTETLLEGFFRVSYLPSTAFPGLADRLEGREGLPVADPPVAPAAERVSSIGLTSAMGLGVAPPETWLTDVTPS